MTRRGAFAVVVALCAACGSVHHNNDAAPPPKDAEPADARPFDAGAPDAGTPTPASNELTSGAGHVSGGTMTMDVQIGHGTSQAPATGAGTTVEGNTAIKH